MPIYRSLVQSGFGDRVRAAWNWASIDATFVLKDTPMRTTLALDERLLAEAQAYTGMTEKAALVREALKALIERESARRLALLGGSDRSAAAPPRRRPPKRA